MHFVFWQNILSPHQAPFLRALTAAGHNVAIITAETMTDDRRILGWQVPDMGKGRVHVAPGEHEVRNIIESSDQNSIHVMAGARWLPLGNQAGRLCRAADLRMGIFSESADPRGILGAGRWLKYAMESGFHGSHYDFVFGMGEMGLRWFQKCGYPDGKLFPFAYVTDPTALNSSPAESVDSNGTFAILYCGQFIHRKGLDFLLKAFAQLKPDSAQLRLLGDGSDKPALRQLCRQLNIHDQVAWLEKRDAAGVQLEMSRADMLVLPSRHDGWGAVVNESLMVGTPVICSTACGAADLIRQPWLGSVFPAGAVEELAQCLKHWIDLGPRSAAERERVRQWSACIQGEAVARYFTDVMTHVYENGPRPEAPWRL
jgi:glycosyltransferase involved in cell wall biosynthesis